MGQGSMNGRRVVRGGSWNNKPNRLRSANRNNRTADNRNNNVGFRLVQSARVGFSTPGTVLFMDNTGVVRGYP